MKQQDVRQAWREKLALNIIIWFICACAMFIIAVLGLVICPTQHVFNTSELTFQTIRIMYIRPFRARCLIYRVWLLPMRGSLLLCRPNLCCSTRDVRECDLSCSGALPVFRSRTCDAHAVGWQVSALCNGVSGSVSPWVMLNSVNNTDLNLQYHDFRAFTNDSRPDWYFESMTIMRWNNRVGYIGLTLQEIKSQANSGSSLGIYDGLIYGLTNYIKYPPAVITPSGTQSGGVSTLHL